MPFHATNRDVYVADIDKKVRSLGLAAPAYHEKEGATPHPLLHSLEHSDLLETMIHELSVMCLSNSM